MEHIEVEYRCQDSPTAGRNWQLDALGNWQYTEERADHQDDFNMERPSRCRFKPGRGEQDHRPGKPQIDEAQYSIISGRWKLAADRIICHARDEEAVLLLKDTELDNPTMSVDLKECGSLLSNGGAGFIFGWQNEANYYFAGLGSTLIWNEWDCRGHQIRMRRPATVFVIGRVTDGQGEILASETVERPWRRGFFRKGMRLALEVTEEQITLSAGKSLQDAETVLEYYNIKDIPEGKTGLGAYASRHMELAFFDNLSIKGWEIQQREHNAANELIEIDGTPLLYEGDGNLTDDGTRTYEWDALNRLQTVLDAEGNALVSYTYDAGNRVVTKTNPEQTIRYIYDGWQVIEEHRSGQTEKEYIYSGQYIDDRIMMLTDEGEFYYQTNNQFSVASMTDSSGEVTCRYFYTPYGEHSIEGENHGNPYTYTGRRYESETGLHNFRFRWYSVAKGRFLSNDMLDEQYWPHYAPINSTLVLLLTPDKPGIRYSVPILRQLLCERISPLVVDALLRLTIPRENMPRYKQTQLNEYTFVGGNPLISTDPSGLQQNSLTANPQNAKLAQEIFLTLAGTKAAAEIAAASRQYREPYPGHLQGKIKEELNKSIPLPAPNQPCPPEKDPKKSKWGKFLDKLGDFLSELLGA